MSEPIKFDLGQTVITANAKATLDVEDVARRACRDMRMAIGANSAKRIAMRTSDPCVKAAGC